LSYENYLLRQAYWEECKYLNAKWPEKNVVIEPEFQPEEPNQLDFDMWQEDG
jgi:hypothetical protein